MLFSESPFQHTKHLSKDQLRLNVLPLDRERSCQIARSSHRRKMLLSEHPCQHAKQLTVDALHLLISPLRVTAVAKITCRSEPLSALLRLIAQPRPPHLRKATCMAPVKCCLHV